MDKRRRLLDWGDRVRSYLKDRRYHMADVAIKSDAQFGYITVKLEYGSPVELNSFVKSLAGLAQEYERFATSRS